VGYNDILSSQANLNRLSVMLKTAFNSGDVGSKGDLDKLVLQNDYLDFYETFKAQVNSGKLDELRLRTSDEILKTTSLIIRKLSLKSPNNLPTLSINDFFGNICIKCPGPIRSVSFNGCSIHEIASNFRYHDNIYLTANSSNIFTEDDKRDFIVPASGDIGIYILVEYRSLIDSDGHFLYTRVPRSIRLEYVCGSDKVWVPYKYELYNIADSDLGKLSIEKIAEDSGGSPFQNLPNAYNSYRCKLETSCMQCHSGGIRMGKNQILALFREPEERSDQVTYWYREHFADSKFEEDSQ
jgi:hypothetical protein